MTRIGDGRQWTDVVRDGSVTWALPNSMRGSGPRERHTQGPPAEITPASEMGMGRTQRDVVWIPTRRLP